MADCATNLHEFSRLGGFVDLAHDLLVAHDDNETRLVVRICNNREWHKWLWLARMMQHPHNGKLGSDRHVSTSK